MIGRLLCRLGIHRWDFHTIVEYGFVDDYHWCQRPGCRYEQAMLVNREETWLGRPPPQQGPFQHAA